MNTKVKKELKIISLTIACWGILLIGSGIAMTTKTDTIVEKSYSIKINQTKVAESKTNEIKLKDMTSEVNIPLSVDVKDYLENTDLIEPDVLKSLKLDTSGIKIEEPGTYTYTISYKKKKYNGTYVITEKELPKVNITLKNLNIEKDSTLSTTDYSFYIEEKLEEEVLKNLVLDISGVKTSIEGTYQYTITYNKKVYTANITVYTPKVTQQTTTEETTEEEKDPTEDNTDNNETQTQE